MDVLATLFDVRVYRTVLDEVVRVGPVLAFPGPLTTEIISNYNQRGVLKLKNQEKSSEMNVSERDLIPVKISAPNSKY